MNKKDYEILTEMASIYGTEVILDALRMACLRMSDDCKKDNDTESAGEYEQEAVIVENARKKIVALGH